MAFDVQGALKAGYSPAEVADFLGSKAGFNVNAARDAGYSDQELIDHLASIGTPKIRNVEEEDKRKPLPEGVVPSEGRSATPMGKADPRLIGSEPVAATTDAAQPKAAVATAPAAEQGFIAKTMKEGSYLGSALERGWNSLKMSVNGYQMSEYGDLLDSFNKKYTPEQVAASPELQKEKQLRENAFAKLAQENAQLSKENEAILKSDRTRPASQKMFGVGSKSEGWLDTAAEIGKAVVEDPGSVVDLALSSGPSTVASLAASTMAYLGTRNPRLAAAAGGAGSGYVEFGNEYSENRASGMSHEEAWTTAASKAGIVGALDAVSMGSAGKAMDTIVDAIKSGATKTAVKEVGLETAKQGALGAAGEAGGALAAGKEVDPRSVMLEAVGETVSAPVEALTTRNQIQREISPEYQLAKALNEGVANTQFVGTDQIARNLLNPNTYDNTLMNPIDTSRISAATSVDEAVAAAMDTSGTVSVPPMVQMPVPLAANIPPPLDAGEGRIEPTLDLNAPLTAEPLPPIAAAPTLPRLTERASDTDLLSRVTGQVPELGTPAPLTAPRPQKIQGVAVSQLSDEQLQAISTDESVPAITRRGASVELTARQAEAAKAAPAAGVSEAPALPLANAPEQTTITPGEVLSIPATQAMPSAATAPVGGQAAADTARATAQASLDRWAASNNVETPATLNPSAPDAEAAVNEIANALNSRLGGSIYAYNDDRATAVNGLAIGGAAFVNTANVDTNVTRTALHEFKHTVEQIARIEARQGLTNTPAQKFVADIDSIFDDMTDEGKRAYLENFLAKAELDGIADPVAREQRLQELMSDATTKSEMTADFLGNRATDKKFWKDVAAADPQGFKGFVEKWLAIVDNLLASLKGKRGQGNKESARVDKYIRDLNKAKAVARDALVAYSQAQQGNQNGSISTTTGEGVSKPSASARPVTGEDGGGQTPEYGTPRAGAISVVARHYSTQPRSTLNGAYYGRGLKGAERDRLDNSPDPRLKNRVYFYVDQGSGIRPEAGVGGIAHEVRLNNVYDPQTKIVPLKGNFNAFESAVINAGFDGYIADFGNNQAAVVLLGGKHNAVPVKVLGQVASAAAPAAAQPTTLKKSLLSKELSAIEATRVPGAQVRGGNLEIPVTSREAANAELERIGSTVRFSKKEIPATIDQFATLETVVPRAREGSYTTNRQLKLDLQTAILAAAKDAKVNLDEQNDETRKYLTRVGVADALYAIQSNANAVGWYDKTVSKALRVLGTIHPEINTDPNAKFAFTWALAVTSNGLKVDKNFELAERAYKAYKNTGKMPTDIAAGQAQKAINEGLGLFNEMVDEYGIDNVRKFMDSKFAVSQIKRATGLEVGGEFADTQVRGAAVLGPKIGNGFFSNLNGFFDQLTMDRWLMRTWGRWTGTLIEVRPDMVKAKRAELKDLVVKMKQNAPAALQFQKALGARLQVGDLDALALAIQKASMDPDTRAEFNKTAVGESLRKTGNNLAKYIDGQKESPAGPEERNFIRSVFNNILDEVRAQGNEALTMSDLQALLWYPEKRLYDIAKSDEDAKEGYTDDEAPDYANAAAKLARNLGVSEAAIQQANREAESDYENRISAGPTESDTRGQQATANVPPAVRGFTGREKQEFLTTGVVHRVRSAGTSDEGQPNSYKRSGGGDGKGLRVLDIPSVAVFKPAATFKNALAEVPAAAPTFLEVGADGAKTFRDSILSAKQATRFGAAVHVYDQADYEGMRLFLTEDGKAGFALKGDDIVSVFVGKEHRGAVNAILQLATQEGGRRLDAFDTVLPNMYGVHGFKAVARIKWNDEYAPEGWDKDTFKDFNNGEPDVVFMVHDPESFTKYTEADGKPVSEYDDGVAAQDKALKGIKQVRQTDLESLESIFKRLEKRGLALANAKADVARRPDAAQINYMEDNFLDILDELDTAGVVKINCK